jgi:hypothetical protein
MPTVSPKFHAPLFPSPTSFVHNSQLLGISPQCAEILDDIRFLTLSITFINSTTKTTKIRSTASRLNSRMSSVPQIILPDAAKERERQLFTTAIRLAALVYTSSVASLTPFAEPSPTSLKYLIGFC